MDFSNEQKSSKSMVAMVVVAALHLLVVYALVTGLAREVVEAVKKPIEAKIIDEVKPPPPPPPPPPEPPKPPPPPPAAKKAPPKPRKKPPPPAYVPPAEVQTAAQPSENAISAVSNDAPPEAMLPTSTEQPEVGGQHSEGDISSAVVSGDCEKPTYPRTSLRNGEQGITEVTLTVSPEGEVTDSEVSKTSGFRDLDRAALRALSLCKFSPATQRGRAVESKTVIQYEWKLDQG